MSHPSPSPQAPAVVLHDATYRHAGGHGVEALSVTLPRGEVLALLGPNGAGKSTALHLVAGLLEPQQGSAQVLGGPLTPARRRHIGVLFQESSLDPQMTVRETLWLHGRLFALGRRPLRRRIADLLALLDLSDRANDAVETLSGGMKRRLELARAVLHEPDLLLLDEPSLGLDPGAKAQLWDLLHRSNAGGAALLIATNDVAEAEQHCRTVAFLERGRLVTAGPPARLKRDLRRDSVRVEWPAFPAALADTLAAWPDVGRVTCAPPIVHITVDDAATFVPQLFRLADGAIQGIRIRASSLEDAYFQWVGTPLQSGDREEAGP